MRRIFLVAIFCFSFVIPPASNGGIFLPDSLKIDTLKSSKSEIKSFHMKKSPWLAVLQSAVLPGLGQLYNQSYWKIPVILGLTAYLGYEIYDNTKIYHDYRDQYANSQTPNNPYGDLNLQALRNLYHDQRDEFIWYFAIVYVVNLVDAYVDAHLFDFDVREDKPIRFGINPSNRSLNFHIKF
jgi:uncharacterized protein DUF5683